MAGPSEKSEKPASTTEVTLLMPHTHSGESFKKGDKIKVTEAQAKWLQQRGVIAQSTITGSK